MSEPDLRLELDELRQLTAELAAIAHAFDDAGGLSGSVAEATGDDGLAGHVRDFARTWQAKRQQMAESVQALHRHLEAMTNGFTEVDARLAAAVEGKAG